MPDIPTVQNITPETDPEIIFMAQEIKRLKQEHFFGHVIVHMEDGIAMRYTTESSQRIPMKHLPAEGVARVRSRGKQGDG